jgi:hypothetical protein
MGIAGGGALSSLVKRPGREAGHTPPTSVQDKNDGAVPSLPHTPSWLGA